MSSRCTVYGSRFQNTPGRRRKNEEIFLFSPSEVNECQTLSDCYDTSETVRPYQKNHLARQRRKHRVTRSSRPNRRTRHFRSSGLVSGSPTSLPDHSFPKSNKSYLPEVRNRRKMKKKFRQCDFMMESSDGSLLQN